MQYNELIKVGVENVSKLIELSRRLKKEAEIIDNILRGYNTTDINLLDRKYFEEKGYSVRMDDFTKDCRVTV